MKTALYLLALQELIGAFDTAAGRDFFYGILFCTLPWTAWKGTWTVVLLGVITAEIILTLWDFVVEIAVRKDLGDVYAGERVTHAVMGIVYGAMIASFVPTLSSWWGSPTSLHVEVAPVPQWLSIVLTARGIGVVASGLRDLYAALGLPGAGWPWELKNP